MPSEEKETLTESEAPISGAEPKDMLKEITEPDTGENDKTDDGDTGAYFESLMADDLAALKAEFPALEGVGSIIELEDPRRYAQLRDLGLTPSEAYRASTSTHRRQDTRAHLTSTVPKFANAPRGKMSDAELAAARELFSGMSDSEIRRLHKKVTA